MSGCVADDDPSVSSAEQAVNQTSIDPRRSLAVTEQTILERFAFQRVLDQLVAQSGVPDLTSLALFQQWWDTQNPPQCTGVLNDYPYACRPAPAEGAQATVDPFVSVETNPNAYIPIGLFNRFDLAPFDGSNCGEYRIVYARRAGITDGRDRNLVIIEAVLPNPHPQQGLKGCRKIAKHWADLTDEPDLEARADALEELYFEGLPGMPPVIHIDHLGAIGGQVRTNQFMQVGITPGVWSLREFKLDPVTMQLVPATTKNTAFGELFSETSTHPQAAAFRAAFLTQIEALAVPEAAEIDVEIGAAFTTGQSQASGTTENNYLVQLGTSATPFRDAIAARLVELGSTLTPDEVVARAQFLSCAGCHRLSNGQALGGGLFSPSSLGFVHVSERDPETVDGEVRFQISTALIDDFLPVREEVIETFLDDNLKPPKKPKDPIGRKRVH